MPFSLLETLSAPLRNGHAYLDPGTGSFVLQVLVASLLGAVFIIKRYWIKIVSIFRKRSTKSESDPDDGK